MTDETTANAPSVEKAPALTPRAASRIEDTLREIWQDVLHVEAIGVEDDFFEIGGHSLLAVQIFDEITKRLGVNLPIASLFQATTIQQLAELVREATPKDKWTSLVPINTSGTKSPLFLMHAAGGNVLFYKDLASRLGAEQPCYGMQAVGLDGHQSAYERIEDMASHYIDEIMSVQPNGPYCLGGSSLGGLIAYEAAVQLKRKGHAVKLIALIDTWAPGFPKLIPGASRSTIKLYALFDRIQHHVETIRILESGRRFAYVAAKAVKAKNQVRRRYLRVKRSITGGVLKTLGRPLPEGLVSTRNAIQRAAREYSPQPARLDVVLFRATKHNRQLCVDDTLGWESFIQGKLEIQEVTGTHGSIIAEPRVGFVAEKLKELLERPDTARVTSHSDRESVHPFGIREGEKAAAV